MPAIARSPAEDDCAVADLEWIGAVPRSRRFGDVYWSKAGGLAEKRYVFLAGNDLPGRWCTRENFVIAELGFGAGLNFLTTVAAWQESAAPGARLAYIAFEQYPMPAEELARALSSFAEIVTLAPALLDCWRSDCEMLSAEPFAGVELTLFFSDANCRLPMTEFVADAWFLDGFAPARNPELWSASLLQAVFDRTAPGGTFATYAAAGWARRNLQAAGFLVEKLPGFAGKKEMMLGRRTA